MIDSPTDFGAYDSNGVITPIGTVVKQSVCTTPTGVEQTLTRPLTLSLVPNPNHGRFQLSFSGTPSNNCNIEINDILGNTCYSEHLGDFDGSYSKQLNLNSLAAGIYVAQVKNGEVSASQKMVVY